MSIDDQEKNIQRTKNEISKLRKYMDSKMNQKFLLHQRMVTNYQRMMDECVVYEKELEKIRSENARYKLVGQCLMNKVVELTGCKFANSLTGSGKDDDEATHLNLEVCSNKLLAELAANREQAEAASRKLAKARDRLANETETEECLKRCANNLTVLAEADRTRRDCEEAELRTVAKRLTSELGVARCDADRLRTAVEQLMSDAEMGCEPVTRSSEGLREDNIRLQADLRANTAVEAKLRARIAQLETAIQHTC